MRVLQTRAFTSCFSTLAGTLRSDLKVHRDLVLENLAPSELQSLHRLPGSAGCGSPELPHAGWAPTITSASRDSVCIRSSNESHRSRFVL
jgi:hypothetical protein